MAKQHTIAAPAVCTGTGLHTGHETRMTFRPAPEGTGLVFRRMDRPGCPEIPADIDLVRSTDRGTTIGLEDGTHVHTVEHVLAALYALEIDNCYIDVDGPEPPVMDGAAADYLRVLDDAGLVEQHAEREEFVVTDPIALSRGDISVSLTPADELRLSYTIDYAHPALGSQFRSTVLSPQVFREEIASARTFCFLHDVEQLKAAGLIRGGSLDNAVVIGEETVLNETLLWPDEFVRHKLLDLLGDLALFGRRVRGHVTAVKAGHTAHVAFLRLLRERTRDQFAPYSANGTPTPANLTDLRPGIGVEAVQRFLPLTQEAIKRLIPHRDPFLFVDRIVEVREDYIEGEWTLTGDEPFFKGHFPNMPVLPGVIQIEAAAQVGGVLARLRLRNPERIPVLLSMEKVKWRRAILPGETMTFRCQAQRIKSRMGKFRGEIYVGDELATEATVMFAMIDATRVRNHVGHGV